MLELCVYAPVSQQPSLHMFRLHLAATGVKWLLAYFPISARTFGMFTELLEHFRMQGRAQH